MAFLNRIYILRNETLLWGTDLYVQYPTKITTAVPDGQMAKEALVISCVHFL